MRITILGTRDAGFGTDVCLVGDGREVICVGIDVGKVAHIKSSAIPTLGLGLGQVVIRVVDL